MCGAVLAISRSVGVLNAPRSRASPVTAKRRQQPARRPA
jgi:hypothetical protein